MDVGPNGAGKSTLVSAVSRGVDYTGQVLLNGVDTESCAPPRWPERWGPDAEHTVSYPFA
jgi:ABC-type cobalamin/Fe3+-siderophores transport system ATPase subunit